MNEDIPLSFNLPAVARKKVSAFDGGRIASDGGVVLLGKFPTAATRTESPICYPISCAPVSSRITICGDGHCGRTEVMEWCDENGVDFIFGLTGNAVLDRLVDETADDIRIRRALDGKSCLRGFAETSYQGKTWNTDRRACARIEATKCLSAAGKSPIRGRFICQRDGTGIGLHSGSAR